ncbi:MAG: PAS-domain containing protein, partial [Alphaproteobacteria bacterium]|nr:PAS-domain containing protein [Alphaproteobacteria bacterium]
MAFATAVAVICLSVGAVLIQRENALYVNSQRLAVASDLHRVANEMKEKLFGMELVAERLATIASGPNGISQAAVAQIADQLISHHPDILSVAIAPGLRVTHVSPLKGNERVMGIEYWQLPNQFAGISRAVRDNAPVFVGPIKLVQGGRGYILRYPVFLPGRYGNTGKLWGVISIVLDENGLIRNQKTIGDGLIFHTTMALREIRPDGVPRHNLYGDPAIYAANPVTEHVTAVGGHWQIAAIPASGWSQHSPKSVWLAAAVLLVTTLLVTAILMIRHYAVRSHETFNVLSHAIESLDEAFLLFDRDNRLLMANKRVEEYYRVPSGKLKPGLNYDAIAEYGIIKKPETAEEAAPSTEDSETPPDKKVAPDGVEQTADGRWLKMSDAATPEGYTVSIRSDISVQKTAQLAAEAATRQQSEFLSTVSHELRTPLTAIAGRAAFLAKAGNLPASKKLMAAVGKDDLDTEEVRQLATAQIEAISSQGQKIINASELLLGLVNDLLDWAKAEGSELKVVPEVLNATDVATAIVDEMKHQAQSKGLSLICMAAPARVMADPARLRQVLYNLVGNAIKFTKSGTITVTVRNKGTRVIVGVEDTGVGIAQENLDLIFERFKQVDGSDTRTHGGFGLGLTIA